MLIVRRTRRFATIVSEHDWRIESSNIKELERREWEDIPTLSWKIDDRVMAVNWALNHDNLQNENPIEVIRQLLAILLGGISSESSAAVWDENCKSSSLRLLKIINQKLKDVQPTIIFRLCHSIRKEGSRLGVDVIRTTLLKSLHEILSDKNIHVIYTHETSIRYALSLAGHLSLCEGDWEVQSLLKAFSKMQEYQQRNNCYYNVAEQYLIALSRCNVNAVFRAEYACTIPQEFFSFKLIGCIFDILRELDPVKYLKARQLYRSCVEALQVACGLRKSSFSEETVIDFLMHLPTEVITRIGICTLGLIRTKLNEEVAPVANITAVLICSISTRTDVQSISNVCFYYGIAYKPSVHIEMLNIIRSRPYESVKERASLIYGLGGLSRLCQPTHNEYIQETVDVARSVATSISSVSLQGLTENALHWYVRGLAKANLVSEFMSQVNQALTILLDRKTVPRNWRRVLSDLSTSSWDEEMLPEISESIILNKVSNSMEASWLLVTFCIFRSSSIELLSYLCDIVCEGRTSGMNVTNGIKIKKALEDRNIHHPGMSTLFQRIGLN